jgi:hypothetical protein
MIEGTILFEPFSIVFVPKGLCGIAPAGGKAGCCPIMGFGAGTFIPSFSGLFVNIGL